jgi:hypothetical protein
MAWAIRGRGSEHETLNMKDDVHTEDGDLATGSPR